MVAGQLIEIPRGGDFRRQHGVEPVRREGVKGDVVEDTGGVDHRGQVGVLQQPGKRVAVGRIAGGDGDVGAERGQFVTQFRRTFGLEATAAGQQKPPDAVLGDEVVGQKCAERAGLVSRVLKVREADRDGVYRAGLDAGSR